MIGVHGIEVLFNRSLYLTSKEFSWLTVPVEHLDKATLMIFLRESLEARETDEAAKVSYTIFVTFTKLLMFLIGVSLTNRLLSPVWVPCQ
jgi:hypothetical protein